ncbi:hypothetical protein [Sediminibacterium goheungense]|uniref:HEAT repeat protein n=1 Tax=Sediminibacterium goheungense TaxID=1086393 RepID=A0A4R6ISH8_9BACT|nr:hypothetical protein [Sediminibacterium goheungense]TDO25171.1 hypothetical protein BC659_3187 [Sediminibacterium goheungense]
MNIREELAREHSKEQALRIANYAVQNKKKFRELMDCYTDEDYRLSQRAAWSVSWAAKNNPEMIAPYIPVLVKRLQEKGVHDAVIRNAVRVLEDIEIPESFHGEVMNSCFAFIENPVTPAAIKAFSLTVLFNLSQQYPEIKQELKLIIEERWDTETAAFKSRGRKILKAMADG